MINNWLSRDSQYKCNMAACSLCRASLGIAAEHRKVYSPTSEPIIPLLKETVSEVYGRDALHEVFLPNSKLCCPCHRHLDSTTKLKKDVQKHMEKLTQQVRHLGEANGIQRETKAPPIERTTLKRHPPSVKAKDLPASKRRVVDF